MTTTEKSLASAEISPRIGTRILADKATLLSGDHAGEIRDLLEQRGVLVFPQIGFTDDEQVAFTETLGTLATERKGEKLYNVTLDKSVNKQADYLKGSLYWHLDGTMNEVPILASLLTSKALGNAGEGDTEFCNTYAAYEDLVADLSDADKQAYDDVRVVHSTWTTLLYYEPEPKLETLQQMMAIGERELPLVWRHRSGRKSLVLGCTAGHVAGMDRAKSTELLVRLREWATQPQFVYRHQWSVGDLVMWDNTGTMHRATPYDPNSGRLLQRTKLAGEEPFA
jgi:alpha-ketoglutarate-dependent taurine dioxygenase